MKSRFIPADAGNSLGSAIASSEMPVHPRGRGEQFGSTHSTSSPTGSSPRTRGTGRTVEEGQEAPRFIPADAGNSMTGDSIGQCGSVHPRGRGEQQSVLIVETRGIGSSPRTRGTASWGVEEVSSSRFIPADAGNSAAGVKKGPMAPVHPRGRGEQLITQLMPLDGCGSSPRTRGTAPTLPEVLVSARFIPADAGNSTDLAQLFSLTTVHPRGRGEQKINAASNAADGGSSPRTRGTEMVTLIS